LPPHLLPRPDDATEPLTRAPPCTPPDLPAPTTKPTTPLRSHCIGFGEAMQWRKVTDMPRAGVTTYE
jgi:hypothetical protein